MDPEIIQKLLIQARLMKLGVLTGCNVLIINAHFFQCGMKIVVAMVTKIVKSSKNTWTPR